MLIQFSSSSNFVQQCIQISTKILQVYIHTSSFVSFETIPIIQHGVRIEAVATSLQEGESTDRLQQFPAYLQTS